MKFLTEAGQRFKSLTVIKFSHKEKLGQFFKCRCDCGNVKTVNAYHLLSGNTKSCGCYAHKGKHVDEKNLPANMRAAWGCPGYFIDDKGQLFNNYGLKRKALVRNGYVTYSVYNRELRKRKLAHRLMLQSFTEQEGKDLQAAHINGNPRDNRLENIMWATRKENMSHKKAHGTLLFGERHPVAKLTLRQVKEIRSKYKRTGRKSNAKEMASKFNVSVGTINGIVSGRTWSTT